MSAGDIHLPPPTLGSLSYLYFGRDFQLELESTLSLKYSEHYHLTNDVFRHGDDWEFSSRAATNQG